MRTSSASRPGTTTRSAIPAEKPSICATKRAATSGLPRRCPAAATMPYVSRHGFGYSVFEHSRRRHSLRAVGLRGHRRAGQVLGAEGAQRVGPTRGSSPRPAMRSGCWAICGRSRACTSSRRSIRPAVRCLRATPTTRTSATGRHSSMWTMRLAPSPATAPNSSAATARSASPAAMARSRLFGKTGPALDPCAAMQVAFELADGQEREIIFRLGCRTRCRGCKQSRAPVPRADRRTRRTGSGPAILEAHARRGAGRDTGPVPQRPDQWLAPVPDPGLPCLGAQRLLPIGRRLRLPRSAAGRDGAGPRRA